MTRESYHHGALHRALLEAAIEAARRVGPQGVQVRSLAKIVGVSPAAVYRHFSSVEALHAEVSQAAREGLAAFLIERRDRTKPGRTRKAFAQDRFRAVGRAYVDFARAEPQLFETAFGSGADPVRPDDPSAWAVLLNGVQELIDTGAISSDALAEAALIAWSGVHGIAALLARESLTGPVTGESAIEVVLDGIMRSLETL